VIERKIYIEVSVNLFVPQANKQNQHKIRLNILTLERNELKDTLRDLKMPYSLCSPFSTMKMSQDDKILFYSNCDLLIYNLSNPSSPTLESQTPFGVSQTYGLIFFKDQKILYVFGLGSNGVKQLQIRNISDLKAPQLLNLIEIPQQITSEGTDLVEISSVGKTLFLGFRDGVLRVDVRVPNSPILFGYNYFLQKIDAEKFVNNSIFYALSPSGVTAFDISSEYILHIKNPQMKIGGSYSKALNVLKLNKNFKFDFMVKKHKFLKVSLFDNSISLNTESFFKTLPNWIAFDQERSLLKIEPNSPSHNGTYRLSVTLTTQTQPSAFIGLDSITNPNEAKDLMLNLIQSGYIDNQGYISGDLDINQELWINSKYQNIEKDIRAILSRNYIQAIGEIFVSPSLSISETKPLKISSLSKNAIHVTIQFDQNRSKSPRFLDKAYSSLKPTIVNSKSLLLLEGPLESINQALQEIVVDLNGLAVCNGQINITDGINPPIISHRIPSLSNYLHINDEPRNSLKNLQDQVDSNPFYTGLYSAMIINSSTFTDKNNLTLDYSLELEDSKLGLPPAWITLRGLSLMATPPESYTKFSYKFVLRVSNEFQNITAPFALKVRISFYYAVKLAFIFLEYTISLIGFIYSVNKGYNIVARKYYRHSRSFKLKVGEEINDTNLFPFSFVHNEVIKSEALFKNLEKHVTQNYRCSLLEHFVDPHSGILDQQKIIDALKLIDNHNIFDSDTTDIFSIGTIQQLIINRIVMKQLSTKQETKTRHTFNKIKTKWMDLVTSAPSPAQFVINSDHLDKELSNLSLKWKGGESLNETHFESSENLLNENSFNIDLLANAIVAHAFSYQNVDINLILIDIISHKRIKGKTLYHWIKKLLLKNLKPFVFLNKREIGCGIEYKTDENTLQFSGKLTHELKNDTIVIHLKNHRGRILREFWIVRDNQAIQSHQSYVQNISEAL